MTVKETFSQLNDIIKGKRIVCVPIVSSINRKTDEYKLDCDGNINRIVTAFSHANDFKELIVFLPTKYESMNILKEFKDKNEGRVHFRYTSYFGKHAGEQRNKPDCYTNTLRILEKYFSNYDYFFIESQGLGIELIHDGYQNKVIFYNNVCEVEVNGVTKTRSFMQGYNNENKYLVNNSEYTICVSPETTEYWRTYSHKQGNIKEKVLNCPYLIDRDLPYFNYTPDKELQQYIKSLQNDEYEVIYLPYRLTDEGYQVDKVIKYIHTYNIAVAKKKLAILYSDPNDSGYMETIKEKLDDDYDAYIKYVKVSTDRNIYYTLLDCKNIIIPYFEDIAFVNHASIHEMFNEQSDCIIVLDTSQTLDKLKDYGNIPTNRVAWY